MRLSTGEAPSADVPTSVVEVVAAPAGAGGPEEQVRPARAKIFFTLGEQDGADAAKVSEAVKALAPDVELQDLEVRRAHTFLYVKPEAADSVVVALDGKEWNGKKLGAEKARRRRR
jgi:ATP-dependent RNA helicase DeaD